ncbi:Hypothetical predicted protein [Octopus vulgaris]|uniref:Uncharacterized protein n=1 Tax=Octopus vulgaris TaxID=6645 RepID=A0AA36B530_OCTVU|nr:Hypothetical predicted protein [Octopus vulgaris]
MSHCRMCTWVRRSPKSTIGKIPGKNSKENGCGASVQLLYLPFTHGQSSLFITRHQIVSLIITSVIYFIKLDLVVKKRKSRRLLPFQAEIQLQRRATVGSQLASAECRCSYWPDCLYYYLITPLYAA